MCFTYSFYKTAGNALYTAFNCGMETILYALGFWAGQLFASGTTSFYYSVY